MGGWKANDEAAFLLHVDAQTGVILRQAREDEETTLDVEELMLGTVTERERARRASLEVTAIVVGSAAAWPCSLHGSGCRCGSRSSRWRRRRRSWTER